MRALLIKAIERRRSLISSETNCCRLFCAEPEGIAGMTLDRFGDVLICQIYDGLFSENLEELKAAIESLMAELGVTAVYLKEFVTNRSHTNPTQHRDPQPWIGQPCPETFIALENGLKFNIRPYDGYSVGLFLDQRNNRDYLASICSNGRLLNLFCYSGGFSVYAARAGTLTVNVDVSKKALAWVRQNFESNELPTQGHAFVAEDSIKYLQRLVRREELFECVVVDPPSFGRDSSGKAFSLQRDFDLLLETSWSVVAPGGYLFFSCNLESWSPSEFESRVRKVSLPGSTPKPLPKRPIDFQFQNNNLHQLLITKS